MLLFIQKQSLNKASLLNICIKSANMALSFDFLYK